MRRGWALVGLLAVACGTGGATPSAHRVIATPQPTGRASVTVTTAKPTAKPAPTKAPVVAQAPPAAPQARPQLAAPAPAVPAIGIGAYRGLGSWIDVFDHTDDPATVVPLVKGMARQGTKTLYLESARYSTKGDFEFPRAMAAALDEAKAEGMQVVAWYPPDFADIDADVRRSVAAVRYRSPAGNSFDSFAADIEYTAGVPDHAKRNKLVVEYSQRLRKAAGPTYPLAAIVIPPSWLERNPSRWPDFPWAAIGANYDIVMPMEYWTALGKDANTAYHFTKNDTQKTQALTGRPVHTIGGLGADADEKQTAAYVKAAKESGSLGGGLYDYTTTRPEVWGELRKLNG